MTKHFLQRTKAVVNTFFWQIKAIVITWFVIDNVTSYEEVKRPNAFYDELRPLLMPLFWQIKAIISTWFVIENNFCDEL